MKIYILHITLFFCGLLLINSPISAQVLLPQYSVWEGFAFGNKLTVESREAEERFARFLLGLEQQNTTQQAEQIGALLFSFFGKGSVSLRKTERRKVKTENLISPHNHPCTSVW